MLRKFEEKGYPRQYAAVIYRWVKRASFSSLEGQCANLSPCQRPVVTLRPRCILLRWEKMRNTPCKTSSFEIIERPSNDKYGSFIPNGESAFVRLFDSPTTGNAFEFYRFIKNYARSWIRLIVRSDHNKWKHSKLVQIKVKYWKKTFPYVKAFLNLRDKFC